MIRHRAATERSRHHRRRHAIPTANSKPLLSMSRFSMPPFSMSARRDTGRSLAVVVLVALAVGGAACASDEPAPTVADYVSTMQDICRSTDSRLDALGTPPDDINPGDWAREVGLAFRAESESAGAIVVVSSIGEQHRRLVRTTTDLAQAYADLADAIDAGGDISTLNTEITQLSLGRDDLAVELELAACARSGG